MYVDIAPLVVINGVCWLNSEVNWCGIISYNFQSLCSVITAKFLPLVTNICGVNQSLVTGHMSQWMEVPVDVLESHKSLPKWWDSNAVITEKTGARGHLHEGWGDPPNNGVGGVGWNLPHLINTNPFPGGMVMWFRETPSPSLLTTCRGGRDCSSCSCFGSHGEADTETERTVHCVTHLYSGYSRKVLLLSGVVPVGALEGEARSSGDLIRWYQLCEQLVESWCDVTVTYPLAIPSYWFFCILEHLPRRKNRTSIPNKYILSTWLYKFSLIEHKKVVNKNFPNLKNDKCHSSCSRTLP